MCGFYLSCCWRLSSTGVKRSPPPPPPSHPQSSTEQISHSTVFLKKRSGGRRHQTTGSVGKTIWILSKLKTLRMELFCRLMFGVDIRREVRGDQAVRGMLQTESINYTVTAHTGDHWRSRYLLTCVVTQQHFNVQSGNIFVLTGRPWPPISISWRRNNNNNSNYPSAAPLVLRRLR